MHTHQAGQRFKLPAPNIQVAGPGQGRVVTGRGVEADQRGHRWVQRLRPAVGRGGAGRRPRARPDNRNSSEDGRRCWPARPDPARRALLNNEPAAPADIERARLHRARRCEERGRLILRSNGDPLDEPSRCGGLDASTTATCRACPPGPLDRGSQRDELRVDDLERRTPATRWPVNGAPGDTVNPPRPRGAALGRHASECHHACNRFLLHALFCAATVAADEPPSHRTTARRHAQGRGRGSTVCRSVSEHRRNPRSIDRPVGLASRRPAESDVQSEQHNRGGDARQRQIAGPQPSPPSDESWVGDHHHQLR